MENLIEQLASANANLANANLELQKENRELRANLETVLCKLAEYESVSYQINAPCRNGKGSGPKRATTQPAPSSPQGFSPVDKT